MTRREAEISWANRFVSLLRVFYSRLIPARPIVVLGPEYLADYTSRFAQCLLGKRRGVGSMVGDQPLSVADVLEALEQPLRHLHRAVSRKAQLAACLLRQRRRGERGRRTFHARLLLDRGDRPRHVAVHCLRERHRRRLVEQPDVRVLQLTALRVEVLPGRYALIVDSDQRGNELPALALEDRLEVPVNTGAECPPLFLPLDDQAYRDALHTAGAETCLHLLPEHRRERVSVKTIENTAAFLRSNEVLVDVGWMSERLFHRIFGDLVKDDPTDWDFRLENLREMPADRLAFAVRVGRQQQFGGVLYSGLQMGDLLPFVARHDVVRGEIAFDINAEPAPFLLLDRFGNFGGRFGKVADMTEARLDSIPVAKESPKRLRLRGRFDDDQRFSHVWRYLGSPANHTSTFMTCA